MVKLSDGNDFNLCLSTDTTSKLLLWTKGESLLYFKVINFFTIKSLIITFMPIIVSLNVPQWPNFGIVPELWQLIADSLGL